MKPDNTWGIDSHCHTIRVLSIFRKVSLSFQFHAEVTCGQCAPAETSYAKTLPEVGAAVSDAPFSKSGSTGAHSAGS